jgi:hypothetical protein
LGGLIQAYRDVAAKTNQLAQIGCSSPGGRSGGRLASAFPAGKKYYRHAEKPALPAENPARFAPRPSLENWLQLV